MAIPDYIRRLRELVGTELLLVPCVAALVRDREGRILLVENVAAGAWTLPGGIVEPGEPPEVAAEREAREESGFEVAIGRVLDVFGGPDFTWTYPNGDRLAAVTSVYHGTIVGGAARADGDETSAVAWFDPGALPQELSGRTRRVLERLL